MGLLICCIVVGFIALLIHKQQVNEDNEEFERQQKIAAEEERLKQERIAAEEERLRQQQLEEEQRKRNETEALFSSLARRISSCIAEFNNLRNSYLSYSVVNIFLDRYHKLFDEVESIDKSYLDNHNALLCNEMHDCYVGIRDHTSEYNKAFVNSEISRCQWIFSDIDGKALDYQQAVGIVTDEDHNLIVAGAGSGKTLTIVGKVQYLCKVKRINPKDILLISFTRKAAEEMTNRISKIISGVEAVTFHKLGLDIVSKSSGFRPSVLSEKEFQRFMEDYFLHNVRDHIDVVRALIEYFAYYLHIPSNIDKFNTLGEAYEYERNTDFETLQSKYIIKEEHRYKADNRTMQGEFVKSREELIIANYLFLHGIKYEYEKVYPYKSEDSYRKIYTPDFYLSDYDIYLEHFGIGRNGKNSLMSNIENKKYLEDIQWKRNFHRQNGTKLIETYSYYNSEGILEKKLEEILVDNGVKIIQPDYMDIFNRIYQDSSDKYFGEFIQLCSTFIALFKSNGYKLEDLDQLQYKHEEFKTDYHKRRMKAFKTIIKPVLNEYYEHLRKTQKVDFSDMINDATEAVINGFKFHRYKYVIIDEFQDISVARLKLIKAILNQTGAHLLCVGDDWQSIYRFAGSDLSVFVDFEKSFGKSEIMRIEKTYRNSQQLIDAASQFVMKNPAQLKKSLKSDLNCDRPICFVFYQNDPKHSIKVAMESIISTYGVKHSDISDVLLLGRTNYDREILIKTGLFRNLSTDKSPDIEYVNKPDLKCSFLSVHKSKGLEAQNVIVLNFCNSLMGFPNKIADDPMLELVLSDADTFRYGEERRLLYVALTRTKNRVLLITDAINPSEFIHDFEKDENIRTYNAGFSEKAKRINCPKCSTGILVERKGANKKTFVGCSNFPQCDFTCNDLSVLVEPVRCKCGGIMVLRKGVHGNRFYGCTNFPVCRETIPLNEVRERQK